MSREYSRSQTSATRRNHRPMPSTWTERDTPATSKALNQLLRACLRVQALQWLADLGFLSISTCAREVGIVFGRNSEYQLVEMDPMSLAERVSLVEAHF